MEEQFLCANCGKGIKATGFIGTKNRNHCPFCLYSKHVDILPGDRKENCRGLMEPVGLTFKHEGEGKQGEIMLVHQCLKDKKISINRIAGDDNPEEILKVFDQSLNLDQETKDDIKDQGIDLLDLKDKPEILTQLYGKKI